MWISISAYSAVRYLPRHQEESASSSAPINAVLPGGMLTRKRSTVRPYITSPVPTAVSLSHHTAMPDGSTAVMPVTLQTVSKAVMAMSETVFQAELKYQTAISIAKNLRSQGLLTEKEYTVIDTKLQADFSPSLGTLLSENDWTL